MNPLYDPLKDNNAAVVRPIYYVPGGIGITYRQSEPERPPYVIIHKDELAKLEECRKTSELLAKRKYGETADQVKMNLDKLETRYKCYVQFYNDVSSAIPLNSELRQLDLDGQMLAYMTFMRRFTENKISLEYQIGQTD